MTHLTDKDIHEICNVVTKHGNRSPAELRAFLYDRVPGTLTEIGRRYRTRGDLLAASVGLSLENHNRNASPGVGHDREEGSGRSLHPPRPAPR